MSPQSREGAAIMRTGKSESAQTDVDAAIQVAGLTRQFGAFLAVDDVELTVRRGELFSLLGPNGAGKTTLIKMLCCLLEPTSGTATVLGYDIQNDPLAVKHRIAVSPQETAVAERLSARENLLLMAGVHGVDKVRARNRSEELLAMMALTDRADEQVRKYSGGMKRRLSIAMALVSDPQVLFLDEPTLGLDPQSRRTMWDYIEQVKGAMTIVHTTHYLEEADALADTVAIIEQGKLIAQGSPTELKGLVSGGETTVIEADLSDESYEALQAFYPVVRRIEGGAEIESDDVTLHDIENCLRPSGVVVEAFYKKHVTLDDVFLELTGKELRQ